MGRKLKFYLPAEYGGQIFVFFHCLKLLKQSIPEVCIWAHLTHLLYIRWKEERLFLYPPKRQIYCKSSAVVLHAEISQYGLETVVHTY